MAKNLGNALKTVFDYALTAVGTICISPLLAYVAYRIKKEDPGPVFFAHMRIGKDGKPFPCYKFRSMVTNSQEMLQKYLAENPAAREEWERDFKLKDDPRVTPIGKVLRRTSLDELPQIFNVLRGEMSLVGPRPVVQEELDKYYGETAKLYCTVKPGITGLWQVSGRSDTTYAERVALDEEYIRHRSFLKDVDILIRTIKVVSSKGGHTDFSDGQYFPINLQLHAVRQVKKAQGSPVKRFLDVLCVVLGSPVVLPIVAYVYYRIKKDSPGGAFYYGKRLGRNGKLFKCYKFRSMYTDGEAIIKKYYFEHPEKKLEYEIYHKLDDDPRVTPFGQFIRRTSIDELPQIFNVLLGHMSLVGPRPYLPNELEDMGEAAEVILQVKPGITGYWQVNGRSNVDFESRLLMDCWYVKNRTLWMDMKLLWQTVGVVLMRKGAK